MIEHDSYCIIIIVIISLQCFGYEEQLHGVWLVKKYTSKISSPEFVYETSAFHSLICAVSRNIRNHYDNASRIVWCPFTLSDTLQCLLGISA